MPLQATSGAASYDAFGGGVAAVPNYIEDVFSTWLYTGNGSTQTITNGIDLAGKGGLVWTKARTQPFALNNSLIDTVRGNRYQLYSDLTNAQVDLGTNITNQAISSFNSNGFTLGGDQSSGCANYSSAATYASWTFRKQPKFFDVVTWTGNGTAGRAIPHNLGSTPGCIFVKTTSNVKNWAVWHRAANGGNAYAYLNTTDAFNTNGGAFFGTGPFGSYVAPTSTNFTVSDGDEVNKNGWTYVAYIFAHNAGGFGLTGTDNVISCGSYTGTGAVGNAINLGYEAQWVMIKRTDADGYDWNMFDVMRGMSLTGSSRVSANTSAAEINSATPIVSPTATGFSLGATTAAFNGDGGTYIYIAIRRGPMKVPTDGTKVFIPVTQTDGGTVTTNFPVDLTINGDRSSWVPNWFDRLRGGSSNTYAILNSASTNAEAAGSGTGSMGFQNNTGYRDYWNNSGLSAIYWSFQRAPGFFDEVCYTGTGAATTVTHNLTAVPELMIVKNRGVGTNWAVYSSALGATQTLFLNTTATPSTITSIWNDTAPTSSVFTVGSAAATNTSTNTYVAYLFASCPGVSKVFSFTGNGSTQTINCGFAGGARFVLLKASSATGGWYVYDTARGMTTLTDPYLQLNSTAAESATLGSVTTVTTGFAVNESVLAGVNTNGVSYIGLAIA